MALLDWLREGTRPKAGPLFSVVIPTRNCGAEKLGRSIESVLRQRAGLAEVIVVDGASTDSTLSEIRVFADRVRWVSEQDQGVYSAMNKGIAMAGGEYLHFLGAGDILREGVLERVAGLLPGGRLNFLYGNAWMIERGVVWDGVFTLEKFRKRNICHQAIFHQRGIFGRLGGYNTVYRTLSDYEFNIRCFRDAKIRKHFIDLVIADYEGGGMSLLSKEVDAAFYSVREKLIAGDLDV